MHDIHEKWNSSTEKTWQTMVSYQRKNNTNGDKLKYIHTNTNVIVLTLAFVMAAWLKFLRSGHFPLHVKYLEYYFESLYHCRLFSPLTNNTLPNVAKTQSEWSEKGFQRKMTAASPSVSASQALIALSEHSTESSQPNFSHQRAASVVFVFCGKTESACVCLRERERQTDRQREIFYNEFP